MKVNINRNALRAIALFAANDDVRYYLNAVCLQVRKDDVVLVATDGHRIAAYRLDKAKATAQEEPLLIGDYILPIAVVKQVKKAGRKDLPFVTVAITEPVIPEGLFAITDGEQTYGGKLVDAKFPEWLRVGPRSISGKTAQFNGHYVASFHKAIEILSGSSSPMVPVIGHNGDSAATVRFSDERFFGMLMPVRASLEPLKSAPAWALPVEKPSKKVEKPSKKKAA